MAENKEAEVKQPQADESLPPKEEKEKKSAPKKKKETELQHKLDTLNDTYLRMLAEYDNYRKRTQKEKEGMFADGIMKVVQTVLPVLDNFERALSADSADAEFKNGVDMIYKQLVAALEGLGVCELECKGQPFDPSRHNAIQHIEDENYGENEVVEVFQKGYIYKETVIRHAIVKVAN